MKELFLEIVSMSVSACWLVPAVLVVRLILKKAPRWINVLLWGIVAIRLICPFSLESTFSLIPDAEILPQQVISGYSSDVQTGIAYSDNQMSDYPVNDNYEEVIVSANNGSDIVTVLTIVWGIGVLFMAVYTITSYWLLHRKIDTAVLLRDNICQSENVDSPFVLGIIKPRIYLPFNLDKYNLKYIVAHEQAHICRKDHWWKPLGFLLLTIHWFNPLIWLAYGLLCKDIELACDEKVIKELDNEQRADYTQALVAFSVSHRMIAACPLAFGEVGVKERVKAVMNYRKPAFWMIALAILLCGVVALCFLTNPENNNDISPDGIGIEASVNPEEMGIEATANLSEMNGGIPDEANVLSDIDRDGRPEYVIVKGKESNLLEFYYNNELIYTHEDILPVDMGEAYYLDVDRDDREEIVLTMYPRVNSMPLVEYAVLKNNGDSWEKLEMIQGETLLYNQFPLQISKGEAAYEAVISCEGMEKEISVDLSGRVLQWEELAKTEESAVKYVEWYEQYSQVPAGSICGSVCDWGIWELQPSEYEGHICLKATHGIQGSGKEDIWGTAQVLFDYSEDGKIRFLDLTFSPFESA